MASCGTISQLTLDLGQQFPRGSTRYHSAYIGMAYLLCSYNIHKRVENGYCVWERFHMINLKDGSFCVFLVEVYFFLRDFSCIYQSVLIIYRWRGGSRNKKEYHKILEYSDSLEPLIKQYQNEGLWMCIERSVVHKYFCEKTGASFRSRFLHWPLYNYILVDYFFKCFIPKRYFLSSFVEIRLCVMDEYHIVDVDFIMHED